MIVRKLKGLEDIIPVTSVHWEMLQKGTTYPLPLWFSKLTHSQAGAS
jgi:glutathionyl-hydroquinone reductase